MPHLVVLFILAGLASPANAQTTPTPAPLQPPQVIAQLPDAVQLVLLDMLGDRMTLPVSIDGQGPHRFVLDTGAERSVVSRQLARTLGLLPGKRVMLSTLTGRTVAETVVVPMMAVDTLSPTGPIEAPALEAHDLGAAGLVGLNSMAGRLVSIDFAARSMAVRSAPRRPPVRAARDEIVVRARSLLGQLILTEARIGNQRVDVILDTGTSVSVGNLALAAAANRRGVTVRRIEMTSVTGERIITEMRSLRRLSVGGITFSDLPIAFLDAAPFRRLGLDDRPAMLLGMDAMRLFRQIDIDFANRAVTFRIPDDGRRANSPSGL